MGGGGSGSSSIQENPLPLWMSKGDEHSHLGHYWTRAKALFDKGYATYLANPTYAPQNSEEITAISELAARARERIEIATGIPFNSGLDDVSVLLPSKARAWISSALAGELLSGNPYLASYFQKQAGSILDEFLDVTLPNIESDAVSNGRFGGSSHHASQALYAKKAMEKLAALAREIYEEDYNQNRGLHGAAIDMIPGYAEASVDAAEALRMAGLYDREFRQGDLEDKYRMWLDGQERKVRRIEHLGNVIRAMAGAQATRTEPFYRPKDFAQIAGIAMAGLSMYASYKANQKPFGDDGKDLSNPNADIVSANSAIGFQDGTE